MFSARAASHEDIDGEVDEDEESEERFSAIDRWSKTKIRRVWMVEVDPGIGFSGLGLQGLD
jgi:hypothetical protein